MPEETCKHLFVSFMKKPPPKPPLGKDCNVTNVAAVTSASTVCAPVMHQPADLHDTRHHGLAEKLHGLSEKIHNLGHHRHDSSSGGELGRRSRTGRYVYGIRSPFPAPRIPPERFSRMFFGDFLPLIIIFACRSGVFTLDVCCPCPFSPSDFSTP